MSASAGRPRFAKRIVNSSTSGHHCVPSVERCATWSVRIGEKAKSAPAASAIHSLAPSSRASHQAVSAEARNVSSRTTL